MPRSFRFATSGKFLCNRIPEIALFLPVAIGKAFDMSRLGDKGAI
jgi:hypothetical protein